MFFLAQHLVTGIAQLYRVASDRGYEAERVAWTNSRAVTAIATQGSTKSRL